MRLPVYAPPTARRCWIALVLSPLLAWGAWLLVDREAIGMDTGLATLVACIVWVAAELHRQQSARDDYEEAYAQAQGRWSAAPTLRAWAGPAPADHLAGAFVHGGLVRQGLVSDAQPPTAAG